MATKTTKGRAARKEAAKTAKTPEELAGKIVGKEFVASDFDVSRDNEAGPKGSKIAKRVQGGKLLDDIDEDLSEDEIDSLRAAGVIRPATLDDARATIARDAADEARGRGREQLADRARIRSQYDGERTAIRQKHDAERDAEIRKLDLAEADELAEVDKKAAEAAGGGSAPSDAT